MKVAEQMSYWGTPLFSKVCLLLISLVLIPISFSYEVINQDNPGYDISTLEHGEYYVTKITGSTSSSLLYSTENNFSLTSLENDTSQVHINAFGGGIGTSNEEQVIIQFKEQPVLEYETDIKREIKNLEEEIEVLKTKGSSYTINSRPSEYSLLESRLHTIKNTAPYKIKTHKKKIIETHEKVKKDFKSKGIDITVKKEFSHVFNGISANVSKKDLQKIKNLPQVNAVYPDGKVEATLIDSVPLINADDVWKSRIGGVNVTGANITIAIVDTGIDYTHPDLGNCLGQTCKVLGGYDFVNNDNDPMDDNGHGTHVAGIAAANGTIKGVAPDAKLLAYKVLSAYGSGRHSDVIKGIEQAVIDGADIISMSLGGSGNPDDPMSQAVDTAVDAGVVVTVSAGNSGSNYETVSSPGTARKAITVGATDKSDIIAGFSSRGPVIWNSEILIKPDIVAPGVSICSSQWNNAWSSSECTDNEHTSALTT